MIIYGAGGHAKVVCSCLENNEIEIIGFFDDNPNCLGLYNIKNLGEYNPKLFQKEKMIITIGDNQIRKKVAENIRHEFGTTSHTTAVLDSTTKIGEGTVILHRTVVQRGSVIGNHVILNTNASIDHDCTIEDYSHIAPNATLCGEVKIGEGTLVGAGSVIKPGITIGKWCIIGIGTVIVNNFPDYSIIVGNPGKIVRNNTSQIN